VDIVLRGLAPVGTGASSEDGAAKTKMVTAGEGSGDVRLGGRTMNEFNALRLGRFATGKEKRAVLGWSSCYRWGSFWTLRGDLREACIGGFGNVLVPRRTESGEDFGADRTGAIEGGVLTTTVDTARRGGIAGSHYKLLKASFRTAWVSTSVGRMVMEESADQASLCLFFAEWSRVTKTPALSAVLRLGGRVGGSDCAGTGERSDRFAKTGKMDSVDRHNHRGCALRSPFRLI